ncbi:hypothetical protein GGS26DRAFT_549568 [Hypomontagnella submonticulosa]|nr:hypothetical protein GGS26DRAFT_549568 [Hypomontagnella submonticulosa]
MAPGQNTFSIIPNAPCAINGNLDTPQSLSKRPMTTKQAKKAYQKANKGPKLSKAEQRRQELFEQDRIRKEFEKERNQARARAARDKKREKEEKERAEKKRKGLPLVEVHPSQDTIAWFVRGQRKKNQESQENRENRAESLAAVNKDNNYSDSDSGTLSAGDDPEPPPKKQKIEYLDLGCSPSSAGVLGGLTSATPNPDRDPDANIDMDTDTHRDIQQDLHLHTGDDPPETHSPVGRNLILKHSNLDVDDFATAELLDDELLNELIDKTEDLPKDDKAAPVRDVPSPRDEKVINTTAAPQALNSHSSPITSAKEIPPAQKPEDSASPSSVQRPLQVLSMNEVNSKVNNTPIEPAVEKPKPATTIPSIVADSPAQASKKSQSSVSASRSFRHPKTPMGPPPVPPKFRPPSHLSAANPRTPPFLLKKTQSPSSRPVTDSCTKQSEGQVTNGLQEEQPPTSTQLFVLGNLDDLFPSPSQEVRELFEEPKPIIRKSDGKPTGRTICPTLPPPRRNHPPKSMSPILNPNRFTPTAINSKADKGTSAHKSFPPVRARNPPPFPHANGQFSRNLEAIDMPFFSTQDFLLSSQDVRDLEQETASLLGRKHENINLHADNAPNMHKLPTLAAAKNDFGTGLTTPGRQKSLKQPESSSRTGLIDTNSKSIHSRSFSQLTVNLTLASHNAVPQNTHAEKDDSHRNSENWERHKPLKAPRDGGPPTNCSYRNEAPNTLRTGNRSAPPRMSPKPFFASNREEVPYEYVKERQKTTAWECGAARRKAQEELKYLQKAESRHMKRPLPEHGAGGDVQTASASTSKSGSGLKGPAPRPHIQSRGQPQTRSINQLSSSAEKSGNERATERQRRPQSRSSYQKMLELLEQKDTRKKEEQRVVAASQETDYGDAGLDDVLCEMLQHSGSRSTTSDNRAIGY